MPVLKPSEAAPRRRRFVTYDFEWVPGTYELRIASIYDGDTGEFRYYRSVEDFLDGELNKENRAKWFFAHFGGRADLLLILEVLSKDPNITCDCAMSGSSAIIATIRKHTNSEMCRAGNHSNCRKWTFVDSFWLFRASLSQIGKAVGMEKGGPPVDEWDDDEKVKEWYATVPFPELRDYNEQDCRILWHAIDQFQDLLLQLGSQLQKTIASTAMQLFKMRYLSRDIAIVPRVNVMAQDAYAASRVEVYRGKTGPGYGFDINSSFPYSMTFDCPGNVEMIHKGKLPSKEQPWLARCRVRVPEMYLPPLPYRHKQRLFYPWGEWEGTFTDVDIEYLYEKGGELLKVHESVLFEPRDDLRAYAEDIYTRRKNCTTVFEKILYKYLLNSLYGKFSEHEEKCRLIMNPDAETYEDLRDRRARGYELRAQGYELEVEPPEMYFPGAWCDYKKAELSHNHNPISTAITSRARANIGRFLDKAHEASWIGYVDTDGLTCGGKHWEDDNSLGAMKMEYEFDESQSYAPKVYKRKLKDGTYQLKAKGFSLGKSAKTKLKRFNALAEKKEVVVERMARLKEMLRKGTWKPYDVVVKKFLRGSTTPKRCPTENGYNTRPWCVSELEEKAAKRLL